MHRACAKAGSHPAATANVRGYTVRREGGITEADLTISTIYEAVPCFEQLFYVSGPPTQFVLIRGLSVGAVHCRGGFFTHYTARFTRCNFLHRSISWPIRCQGAGLRPASPCIVCLTKWALCGGGSRGAIITLPTLATTASSPWLRREQERWRE